MRKLDLAIIAILGFVLWQAHNERLAFYLIMGATLFYIAGLIAEGPREP